VIPAPRRLQQPGKAELFSKDNKLTKTNKQTKTKPTKNASHGIEQREQRTGFGIRRPEFNSNFCHLLILLLPL
jgi:hypothetical protein